MNTDDIVLTAMIGVCGAGTIFFIYLFLRNRARGQAALSWPTTEALITKSEVIEWVTSKGGPRGTFDIEYSYFAGGREQVGTRISYGDHPATRPHARATVSRYPKGSRHVARYDPANPEDAVLELAPTGTGPLFVAGAMVAAALFFAYVRSL